MELGDGPPSRAAEIRRQNPPRRCRRLCYAYLAQEYADTEIFLMDFWPVYPALFTLFGPKAITKVCNKHNLLKTSVAASSIKPVAGGPNLILI
ncbi:hypothetical protein F5Y17DRAFT_453822, partial [Xylariaceae sp. FL0594]